MLAKLAAHALRAIARDAHTGSQNQDPPAISHVQLNIPAIFYKAENTVTVLAKLAAHALHAIAHNAHTGFQNQDRPAVSHIQLNIYANFYSCIKQETW